MAAEPKATTSSSKIKRRIKTDSTEKKNQPTRPANLLWYHRPKNLPLNRSPIPRVSKQSKALLKALSSYHIPKSPLRDFIYPRSRSAAVLVALFVGRHGDLYVLLSRRSSQLRSYAGDTSLPGGKVDREDKTLEDTARREAFEEIGLPRDRTKAPLLCVLEPFLASNSTLVTPVVVLILDNTLQPILNADEVTSLFSHPLSSFLSDEAPYPNEPEGVYVPYHTHVDLAWPEGGVRGARDTLPRSDLDQQSGNPRGPGGGESIRAVREFQWQADDRDDRSIRTHASSNRRRPSSAKHAPSDADGARDSTETAPDTRQGKGFIRMHRFLTGREAGGVKPVYGLTASILIRVAAIAHGVEMATSASSSSSSSGSLSSSTSRTRERGDSYQRGANSHLHTPRRDTPYRTSSPTSTRRDPVPLPIDIYPPPTSTPTSYTFTPSMEQRIAYSVLSNPAWREAYEGEGFDVCGWRMGSSPTTGSSSTTPPAPAPPSSARRAADWDLLRRVADWRREGNWGVMDGRLLDYTTDDDDTSRRAQQRSKL
ncbi:hypothetical protein BDV98DRAFT_109112 [Pterulicium gracile]|uniref:Nudix hydrolase domain-containing protein n=1 Tax=Pterulicium gracile TaxID=1884261 RepID=A0A5C3QHE6_9AGAR|nr:hypothetical protein BDV98DRAFT_109112 [Pterula gracilis]